MSVVPKEPQKRRLKRSRRAATATLALLLIYLAVAYVAAPEFWWFREGDNEPLNMRTTTTQGIPGDPINVGIVGSHEEVLRAFAAAGWRPADAITLRSSLDIGISVIFDRPDVEAPVSTLLYDGRKQDLAFEKPVGKSADQRHHARFWRTEPSAEDPRPLWLGAASFDRGVGFSHDTGQITHHIGPDLDAERDNLMRDLENAGRLQSTYEIPGSGATTTGRNGGGDLFFTDGDAIVVIINPSP